MSKYYFDIYIHTLNKIINALLFFPPFKFSETPLEMAYGRKMNIQSIALVDIPVVSMPIARSLKTCDICGTVLCDKTAHFRVAFYCGQPKAHRCNNHAV